MRFTGIVYETTIVQRRYTVEAADDDAAYTLMEQGDTIDEETIKQEGVTRRDVLNGSVEQATSNEAME